MEQKGNGGFYFVVNLQKGSCRWLSLSMVVFILFHFTLGFVNTSKQTHEDKLHYYHIVTLIK